MEQATITKGRPSRQQHLDGDQPRCVYRGRAPIIKQGPDTVLEANQSEFHVSTRVQI